VPKACSSHSGTTGSGVLKESRQKASDDVLNSWGKETGRLKINTHWQAFTHKKLVVYRQFTAPNLIY
jgi:hypothetical protein